jgi:membrane-associated phospholipid phosphatase
MDRATLLPVTETPGDTLMIRDIEQRKGYIRGIVAFTLWGMGFIMLLVASVIVHFHPGPWPFDLQTTVTLQSLHLWSWVNSSIDFVSRLNDPLPVTIALGLWLVGLSLFRWFLPAIFFVFGTVVADLGINALISQLVGRPRPSSPLIHIYNPEPFHSFPSGHTEHNVVYYGFLLFLSFTKPVCQWRYRWILLPFQIVAVLNILGVGYSRVEEGSHWVTDIFGGYLTGALCLFLLIFLYRRATDLLVRWRTKRQREKSIQVHDETRLAAKQGPKNTPGTETLEKRIEEGAERVVEEVQQEVAVAEERIEEGTERVVEEAKQEVAAARRPWYQAKRWGSVLLIVLAAVLVLFGLLAWWVASHPILAIDVIITHDFQESQAPWLRITMIAVSYIGNMPLLSMGLLALAAALFWMVGSAFGSDHHRSHFCHECPVRVAGEVHCGTSAPLSQFGRDHPGRERKKLSQWACYVLHSIVGLIVLFLHHPFQKNILVAYCAVGSFCTVGGAGWSFARLPGRSLGK